VSKRTTLTLDDDVADGLASATRRAGRPYRDIVNEVIRRGLNQSPVEVAPFRVAAVEMRRRAGIEIDDVEGLLDLLDGPPPR
jgi:hypothetical protein